MHRSKTGDKKIIENLCVLMYLLVRRLRKGKCKYHSVKSECTVYRVLETYPDALIKSFSIYFRLTSH